MTDSMKLHNPFLISIDTYYKTRIYSSRFFIYDPECYELEKSLVSTEVKRVRDFALLSENCNDTLNILDDVLNRYQISLFN